MGDWGGGGRGKKIKMGGSEVDQKETERKAQEVRVV